MAVLNHMRVARALIDRAARADRRLDTQSANILRANAWTRLKLARWNQADTGDVLAACNQLAHTLKPRCSGCGQDIPQLDGETLDQSQDRHDREAHKLHVSLGMPVGPSLESMDDVEADTYT